MPRRAFQAGIGQVCCCSAASLLRCWASTDAVSNISITTPSLCCMYSMELATTGGLALSSGNQGDGAALMSAALQAGSAGECSVGQAGMQDCLSTEAGGCQPRACLCTIP